VGTGGTPDLSACSSSLVLVGLAARGGNTGEQQPLRLLRDLRPRGARRYLCHRRRHPRDLAA
jgi:hypothetical protein